MNMLLKHIRRTPVLWLLALVPVVFVCAHFRHDAYTLLFALSVLAIIPLATLLSHATESVAARTGDAVGGLLNATLGNLTELVIALTALKAGQYTLVKSSIAGAIVTNTLFMLGASLLIGGLRHHTQEFGRSNARLQTVLLFLATVAMLIPSAVGDVGTAAAAVFARQLSLGLAVVLIGAYGLSLLFSLKTHRAEFAGAEREEGGEALLPMGLALATLGGVTVLVALVSEVFVESVQHAAVSLGMTPAFVGFIVVALVCGAQEPAGSQRGHRPRQFIADRSVRRPGARPAELRRRPHADGSAVLAGRGHHGADRDRDRDTCDCRRPFGLVRRSASADRLSDIFHDALHAAARRLGMRKPERSKERGSDMRQGNARALRAAYLAALFRGLAVIWPILSGLLLFKAVIGAVIGAIEGWNLWQGMYFAYVTGLTIGYGDLVPRQGLTQFLAIVVGLSGIVLTGLVAALAVQALQATRQPGALDPQTDP